MRKHVHLVGIGMGDAGTLTGAARAAIDGAQLLIGAKRLLEPFADVAGEKLALVRTAEIVEAVRKGHTTLDGVKFYTRAGMGRCQGGFCSAKIMKIISRETGIPMEELTKKGGASRLLAGRLESAAVAPMPEK